MNARIFVIMMVVSVFLARPAYAYIDAGSASMILQMILAGIVGAAMTIKMYWQKIRQFIREIFSSNKNKGEK
jgi:hypothetical protein